MGFFRKKRHDTSRLDDDSSFSKETDSWTDTSDPWNQQLYHQDESGKKEKQDSLWFESEQDLNSDSSFRAGTGSPASDSWLITPEEQEETLSGSERKNRRRLGTPVKAIIAAVLLLLVFVAAARFFQSAGRAKPEAPPVTPKAAEPTSGQALARTPEPTATPRQGIFSQAEMSLWYARTTLSEEEKTAYDVILYAIRNMDGTMDVPLYDTDALERVMTAIIADHAETFWFSGKYSYVWTTAGDGQTIENITLTADYDYTVSERDRIQKQIDGSTAQLLSSLRYADDYEKAKGVFEYLILNTDYVLAEDDQSMVSVLLRHRGVCAGYARSTQYLLHQLGIPCVTVSGFARGESHAWNYVRLDGEWYQLDTTWGDPVDEYGNAGTDLTHTYFCLTSDEMALDHTVDCSFPLPYCTADRCNYYVHEGRYFSTYDRNAIRELLRSDYNAGRSCEFRLADDLTYRETLDRLFSGQEIYEIFEELELPISSTSYSSDEVFRILRIFL